MSRTPMPSFRLLSLSRCMHKPPSSMKVTETPLQRSPKPTSGCPRARPTAQATGMKTQAKVEAMPWSFFGGKSFSIISQRGMKMTGPPKPPTEDSDAATSATSTIRSCRKWVDLTELPAADFCSASSWTLGSTWVGVASSATASSGGSLPASSATVSSTLAASASALAALALAHCLQTQTCTWKPPITATAATRSAATAAGM
mmetsp:Transcript_119212/g.282931  ORF Transcript_119212/g.282931 Transcript_119212/m.282931 type:complete len:202 (-) Transcript_119212:386-991(-)